jgi:uncharacterized membrane protein
MRKTLETISLAALALQVWIYCRISYGPDRLPDRIPIHFDLAGNANGWGTPKSLIFFPVVSVALYLLLTVVVQFPSTFNYPIPVTDPNRARLQALAIDLVTWIKMELVCTFALLLWTCIHLALHPDPAIHSAFLFLPVGVVFVTVAWFIVAMLRAGRLQSAH